MCHTCAVFHQITYFTQTLWIEFPVYITVLRARLFTQRVRCDVHFDTFTRQVSRHACHSPLQVSPCSHHRERCSLSYWQLWHYGEVLSCNMPHGSTINKASRPNPPHSLNDSDHGYYTADLIPRKPQPRTSPWLPTHSSYQWSGTVHQLHRELPDWRNCAGSSGAAQGILSIQTEFWRRPPRDGVPWRERPVTRRNALRWLGVTREGCRPTAGDSQHPHRTWRTSWYHDQSTTSSTTTWLRRPTRRSERSLGRTTEVKTPFASTTVSNVTWKQHNSSGRYSTTEST